MKMRLKKGMIKLESGIKFILFIMVFFFGFYQIYNHTTNTAPQRSATLLTPGVEITSSELKEAKGQSNMKSLETLNLRQGSANETQLKLLRSQVLSLNESVHKLLMKLSKETGQEVKVHPIVNVVPSYPDESAPKPKNCVHLAKAPHGISICTYDPKEDVWVSGAIRNHRLWEADLVSYMVKVLKEHPNMQLVDLGANVGEYTLMAASLGRHVVAVDILDSNIQLLQHSLKLSNLSHLVTVVKNAIYRDRSLKLGFKTYSGNIGGTAVVENPVDGDVVQSICMDDLTPLVKSKSVYVKMDIETSEHHALACGKEFFSSLDVKVIQMEWSGKTEQAAKEIGEFADKFGYTTHVLRAGQLGPKDIDVQFRGDYIFVKN